MDMAKLLEIRKKIKSKKPKYVRQDIHKKKRIPENWRKPRGAQSKVRLKMRGRRARVETGYGSPAETKNLSHDVKIVVVCRNPKEVEKLTNKHAIIMGRIGMKKRIMIINKCL